MYMNRCRLSFKLATSIKDEVLRSTLSSVVVDSPAFKGSEKHHASQSLSETRDSIPNRNCGPDPEELESSDSTSLMGPMARKGSPKDAQALQAIYAGAELNEVFIMTVSRG